MLMWWRINPDEFEKQVNEYDTLKIGQSARGVSFILLILSAVISLAVSYFTSWIESSWLDAFLMVLLGFFIYRGHRWAMIGAMILWTAEKGYQLYAGFSGAGGAGSTNFIMIYLWWALFMRAFYLSYRVEQALREGQAPATSAYAPPQPVAPVEEKKPSGLLVPILAVVVLLSLGYFGYQKYYGSAGEATAPTETSATPSGDTQTATAPAEGQPGEKAPGLMDRISAWLSGEQKPVPTPVAAPVAATAPIKVAAPSNTINATDDNFEELVLHSETPVVVMFWAGDNPPSQATEPQFNRLANEFTGRIKFVKMNVSTSRKAIDQYKIAAWPTLLLFENGEVKAHEYGGGSYGLIWDELGLPGKPPKTDASMRTIAPNVINTTAQDFEDDVLKSNTPVIVVFWSSVRFPELCNQLNPEITKVAAELGGRVKVVRVDVDECYKLTEQYNVGAVPALFLFENGVVTQKVFGVWPADKIKEKLGLQ